LGVTSYSEVLRKIRNANEACTISGDIIALRRTKDGNLVFLRIEAEHSSKLVKALAAAILAITLQPSR